MSRGKLKGGKSTGEQGEIKGGKSTGEQGKIKGRKVYRGAGMTQW